MGLRSISEDVLTINNLLCGCFNYKTDLKILIVLSKKADLSLKKAMDEIDSNENANEYDKLALKLELESTRGTGNESEDIEARNQGILYFTKITKWSERIMEKEIMPLYHPCTHPECSNNVNHWILRSDFDNEYRNKGLMTWKCPLGHSNSILPSQEEIKQINCSLLYHPEYYTQADSYDHCPLRRYRLCSRCALQNGCLLIASHSDGCKQWPAGGSQHQHCFCFHCTRTWGLCGHGKSGCIDPGIQQIRKNCDDSQLEIGYINGTEYIKWLKGSIREPPPTLFETEPKTILGVDRQEQLGLTNKTELLQESNKGTR